MATHTVMLRHNVWVRPGGGLEHRRPHLTQASGREVRSAGRTIDSGASVRLLVPACLPPLPARSPACACLPARFLTSGH